jgi:hypothetical protein
MAMLPEMAGPLLTSIASGPIISRTGRYKAFPAIGLLVATIGFFLLLRLGPETRFGVAVL